MNNKKLFRSTTNRMVCGVCGGLGDFFGIEVAYRVAVGDLAYAVGCTGDIKQALDERGFAVAAVAHETYVTDLVYRIIGHN